MDSHNYYQHAALVDSSESRAHAPDPWSYPPPKDTYDAGAHRSYYTHASQYPGTGSSVAEAAAAPSPGAAAAAAAAAAADAYSKDYYSQYSAAAYHTPSHPEPPAAHPREDPTQKQAPWYVPPTEGSDYYQQAAAPRPGPTPTSSASSVPPPKARPYGATSERPNASHYPSSGAYAEEAAAAPAPHHAPPGQRGPKPYPAADPSRPPAHAPPSGHPARPPPSSVAHGLPPTSRGPPTRGPPVSSAHGPPPSSRALPPPGSHVPGSGPPPRPRGLPPTRGLPPPGHGPPGSARPYPPTSQGVPGRDTVHSSVREAPPAGRDLSPPARPLPREHPAHPSPPRPAAAVGAGPAGQKHPAPSGPPPSARPSQHPAAHAEHSKYDPHATLYDSASAQYPPKDRTPRRESPSGSAPRVYDFGDPSVQYPQQSHYQPRDEPWHSEVSPSAREREPRGAVRPTPAAVPGSRPANPAAGASGATAPPRRPNGDGPPTGPSRAAPGRDTAPGDASNEPGSDRNAIRSSLLQKLAAGAGDQVGLSQGQIDQVVQVVKLLNASAGEESAGASKSQPPALKSPGGSRYSNPEPVAADVRSSDYGVSLLFSKGAPPPLVPVPGHLRKAAEAGEYLHLHHFTFNAMHPPAATKVAQDEAKHRGKTDVLASDGISNIKTTEGWLLSWTRFMRSYLEKRPERAMEMLQYQQFMIEMSTRFSPPAWVSYDAAFRQIMSRQGGGGRWDRPDTELCRIWFTDERRRVLPVDGGDLQQSMPQVLDAVPMPLGVPLPYLPPPILGGAVPMVGFPPPVLPNVGLPPTSASMRAPPSAGKSTAKPSRSSPSTSSRSKSGK